jgi:hypothetical protein
MEKANAGRNMCDLCSRMTRLSCQRDIHAIASWLKQVDPTKVHEDFDYTPNHRFAKLVGVRPADDVVMPVC